MIAVWYTVRQPNGTWRVPEMGYIIEQVHNYLTLNTLFGYTITVPKTDVSENYHRLLLTVISRNILGQRALKSIKEQAVA